MNEPYHLLYIDDDKILLDIGKMYLERKEGFQVDVTTEPSVVLDSLEHGRYDAIISDYEMPVMNGIELLKAVREKDRSHPFILFTGRGREDVVIEALNNGANFYIQKGGDPKAQFAELVHKVRQAIVFNRTEKSLKNSIHELSQASSRYKALIAASNTGAWEYQSDTGFLWCSPEYFSMLGRDVSEYNIAGNRNIEETWMDLLHPDDRNNAVQTFETYLNQPDGMYEQYFRMLHADGHYIWIWSRGRTVLDEYGVPTPITVGTHIDISERRQQEVSLQKSHEELQTAYEVIARAGEDLRENLDKLTIQEHALRESEEKFRTFFESAGDAIIILDNGIIYDSNHQAEELFRVQKTRLIGKSPADFAPKLQPDGSSSRVFADEKMRLSKGGNPQTFEFIHRLLDGTEFFAEVTLQQIRMQGRIFQQAIIRDISPRKLAEMELIRKNEELATAYEEILSAEAESRANQQLLIAKDLDLQQTKNQLDDIISFLPDATFVINQDGIVIAWNRAIEEMTGVPADQILGKGDYEYSIPFYDERRPILIDLALTGDQSIADRYPSITRNGDFFTSEIFSHHVNKGTGGHFWFTACPFYDSDGTVTGAIECIRDISERRNAEIALEKHLVALTRPLEDTSVSFDELFDIKEIQKIQDEFAEATGVASIITHPDGTPITQPSRFTRLCSEIIRKTGKGCENCYRSDAILGSPHQDGPVVQPCLSGGLWDAGASILLGNRHIANWLIGQVRDETQTEDAMRMYAREIGADEEAVVHAFREVPSMPVEQFKSVAQYLFTLANHLSQSAYQNIQQAKFIMERRRIEEMLFASESEYRNVIQNSPIGYHIYRLNQDGKLIFSNFNPAADSILHTGHTSLIGHEILEAFPALAGTGIPEMYVAIARGEMETQNFEAPYDYNGICGTYDVRVFQGAPGLAVVNFIDISERKQIENQLRSSYEQIAADEEEIRHQYEELASVQEKLERNLEQLEAITRTIPGVVYQFYARPDGEVGLYYVSSRAQDILGIDSGTDHFFERFTECVDPRDRDAFLQSNAVATGSGLPWHYEGRFIKPSEEQIWFKSIARPVRHESELIFNGILLDITERKQAEIELARRNEELHAAFEEISATEEELRANLDDMARQEQILSESKAFLFRQNLLFSTLLDNLNVGVFMVTAPGGTPLVANMAAQQMLGRGILPDATGENLSEVYKAYKKGSREPYPVDEMPIIRGMYGDHAYIDDMIVERPDGSEILLEVSGTPILDEKGTITASLVSFTNITDRKRAELELREKNEELKASYGQLKATGDALREANKKLSLLSSITRHDILNKVSVQLGMLDLALESIKDNPEVSQFLIITKSAAQAIKYQIEFTRIYQDLGTHEPQWQDIHRILAGIPVPPGLSVLDDCADMEIFADRMFEKVLENLIDNAIRHGEAVTRISMCTEEGEGSLLIRLEDDGIGIPESEKEKIFERGYGKNTGLGLFLAREILVITGLSIRETGEPGKGARFEILVPEGKWRKMK